MSNKIRRKERPRSRRFSRQSLAFLLILVSVVVVAGVQMALRRSMPTQAPPPIAASSFSPGNTSKEYVYVGDRLIATEEPVPAGGPAPAGFLATATSDTTIALSWTAPAGSISYYEIERTGRLGEPPTTIPTAPSQDPRVATFTDSSVGPGAAYLYRVRAVYADGGRSAYSNNDVATAIVFDDDPIKSAADAPAGATAARMKAVHITQLRLAVDAVRSLAALPAAAWPDTVRAGAVVNADHVRKLRENLDPALSKLEISAPAYSESVEPKATRIKKVHIQELRDRVR